MRHAADAAACFCPTAACTGLHDCASERCDASPDSHISQPAANDAQCTFHPTTPPNVPNDGARNYPFDQFADNLGHNVSESAYYGHEALHDKLY